MSVVGRTSLRPYQQSVVSRVREAWRTCRSVLVQMPTGTGKTVVLAEIVNEELRIRNEELRIRNEELRIRNGGAGEVWIVAHRRELVEQIEEMVARYGMSPSERIVRVLSIQWLSRHWDDMKNEQPRLIIIDEAHHALAETYRELWRRFPNAKKLGMTATPCRLNGRGFTDLFDVMVASDGIADFIRQGWLSAFDYVSIRPDSEDQRLINSLEKRGADGDFQVKEMDAVLNKQPTIERLYESVRQYAYGKKGIVYAVSISHARNIAAYYNNKGLNAVAIDSKTPSGLRRQLVDDFRLGKIQVLVNVDVFSEGFDCPDVEFVQLARPTLSLAKYLQQVGRGQAMFEGRLAGKGSPARGGRAVAQMTVATDKTEVVGGGGLLETILSHEELMERLQRGLPLPGSDALRAEELKPFRDRRSGLWGLRRGMTATAAAQYLTVFDVKAGLAAVMFEDGQGGIVDAGGVPVTGAGHCRAVRLLDGGIAAVTDGGGRTCYIDLKCGRKYGGKPRVVSFGRVEMLEVEGLYYSRTRHAYQSRRGMSGFDFVPRGFYLRIYDSGSGGKRAIRYVDGIDTFLQRDCVCVLADDSEDYYWFCGELADGSIVIADEKGNYFHAMEDREKKLVACDHPRAGEDDFDTAVSRLKAEAEARALEKRAAGLRSEELKRQERLAAIRQAVPFKSGLKWGLKQGDRVVVPPVYRSIRMPVGDYCAVEAGPRQWGVIMLDGRVVVETRYSDVEISGNGKVRLTVFPGMTKTVDLSGM